MRNLVYEIEKEFYFMDLLEQVKLYLHEYLLINVVYHLFMPLDQNLLRYMLEWELKE
jgi:hypothetical protein